MMHFNKTLDNKTRISAHQGIIPQALITILALAAPGIGMAAQPEDALNFSVGAAMRYEDNLFRIDDDTDPRSVAGKSRRSDLINTYNIGIKIDKLYAQQRFQLDLTAIKNDYQTYDYLDFTAKNYRAAWLWHLTPNLSGTILLNRQQSQTNFADFLSANNKVIQQQSIQTTELRKFDADWLVGGGLHLLGGISEARSRNDSAAFTAQGDYLQRSGEVGVKYVARSLNTISLIQRKSNGDYNRSIPGASTGFEQDETEAQINYRLSGKSFIDARLGYVNRQYDDFPVRDYDGMTGRLAHNWAPTGKLQIITSLSRYISSYQQQFNSYYISDTFAVEPIWTVTAKTKIRGKYSYSNRDYRGPLPGGLAGVAEGELRQDKVQELALFADWQATRTILVTGTLQHEVRNSNYDSFGLDYDANSVGLSGQLLF